MLEFIVVFYYPILGLLRYLCPFIRSSSNFHSPAHRCSSVLDKLHEASIKVCFIPAGCTGVLQLLGNSVNEPFKQDLK